MSLITSENSFVINALYAHSHCRIWKILKSPMIQMENFFIPFNVFHLSAFIYFNTKRLFRKFVDYGDFLRTFIFFDSFHSFFQCAIKFPEIVETIFNSTKTLLNHLD